MTNPRFPSKVDWWLGAVLALALLGAAASAVVSLLHGAWQGTLGLVIIVVVYGGLVFPMYYELADDEIVIRFGLARSRIPYKSIRRVVPTRNPLSSPALSLDRLHVDSGSSLGPNISPKDKEGFLRALAERAPHLKRAGDSLVSAT